MMLTVMSMVFALFFTIGLISFDRLMRTIFLNEYTNKFNSTRFNFAVLVTFTLTAVQTFLWGNGVRQTLTNDNRHPDRGGGPANSGGGSKNTLPLNMMSCLATLTFQLISMKRLYNMGTQALSAEVRNLTKLAAIYVSIYFTIYVPVIIFQFFLSRIQQQIEPWQISIINFIAYMTPSLNGILNAIAFLASNRACRQSVSFSIIRIIRRIRPSVEIDPNQPEVQG